jgi:hypothetical protein
VAHACDPRRWRLGRGRFEANQGKKLVRYHLNKNAGHGTHFCNPSYAGAIGWRIEVQGPPWAKT